MNKKEKTDFEKKIAGKSNYILEDTLLDSEVTKDELREFNYEDIVKNSAEARMSKIPWLVCLFLILLISMFLVFRFLNENPSTIFTNTIDRFFLSLTENISDNNYDVSKGKIGFQAIIDSKEDREFLSELSKVYFDINYTLDNANDLLNLKVSTKYDSEDLIDFDLYSDKNSLYIYSADVYEKYLKFKNDSSFKFINPKDIKIILTGLNQAFDKVATSEKISGRKTSFDLGSKSISVYESTLIINEENYKRVSEVFVNTLKSNTEFISSLSVITNDSNKNIQKKLDKFTLNIKDFFKRNETLKINLYNDRKSKDFIKGTIDGKLGSFELMKSDSQYIFTLIKNKNDEKLTGNIGIDASGKKASFNFKHYFGDNLEDSFDAKLLFTNKKATTFKRIDTSEAVSVNDLTDLEKFSIYGKMFSNEKLNKFLKFIK